MSNQRGNHWKRRVIRQIISLGTVPSLFAGALFAAPQSPPGLPGLPTSAPALTSSSDQPKLLPIPVSEPGRSLQSGRSKNALPAASSASHPGNSVESGVNIKILPGLPPAGESKPETRELRTSTGNGQEKGTVFVKMQDSAAVRNLNSAPNQLSTNFPTPSVIVTPPAQVASENETQVSSPVKLSIGDSGIVDLGVQRPRQETVVNLRSPELVKPKKHSLSQPVVLAQAAEIQSIENASPSLPDASAQPKSRLIESNLPVALPKKPPSQDRPSPDLSSHSSGLEHVQNEKPALIDESRVASPLPLVSQNSGRTGEFVTIGPTEPAVSDKAIEPTGYQPPTKVVAARNDSALRQYALRNKPEKTYDLESRGTYTINTPLLVESTVSLNPDVCTVFNNGNSITVAGVSTGNTRVAIAYPSGETRVIEVNVLPVGQQFSRPQSEIDHVKEHVRKVFPDSRIQIVSLPTGEVEVRGTTPTEADARKILELVRKVCLVPVHDRLTSGR